MFYTLIKDKKNKMLSNVNGQTGLACTGKKDINGFVDLLEQTDIL